MLHNIYRMAHAAWLVLIKLQGNTRPNTPLLWTVACDEASSFKKDWYLSSAKTYFTDAEIEAITADRSADGVDKIMKIPSPYMNTYLERWFGETLGEEMKTVYGCPSDNPDCYRQVMEFNMAKIHVRNLSAFSHRLMVQ